jgi:hypothetical protein
MNIPVAIVAQTNVCCTCPKFHAGGRRLMLMDKPHEEGTVEDTIDLPTHDEQQ